MTAPRLATRFIHYAETQFGFEYGAAKIERAISEDDGSVVIMVTTKRETLDIRITPTGFIRVGKPKKQSPRKKQNA